MGKLVSVILPTCNVNILYLTAAINSILNQTYSNIELFLIDSSDTDEIKELVTKRNDLRLHYCFKQKNGIADALNFGLELAKGEYIARMDADDVSLPYRLEKQVGFLEAFPDIDVVGSYCDTIDSNGNVIENRSMFEVCDYESIKSSMIFDNPMNHPTIMFRRKIVDEGWRYQNVCAEDHDLWTRMLPTVKFANINEILLQYRQHGGNISFQLSRPSLARSVAETTKQYIETLFCMDTENYQIEDFAKNYYLYFFYAEIGKNITGYFMRQFFLLIRIYMQNEKSHLIDHCALIFALNRRWIILMRLVDYIVPTLKDLFAYLVCQSSEPVFFADNISKFYGSRTSDYEKIALQLRENFCENEKLYKEIFANEKKFLMYGMGEQGYLMLEKYENLKRAGQLSWHLTGIVDRRCLTVTCMGHNYCCISKEQIQDMDFDYILISSAWYFNDIKKELIELGIREDVIMQGAGLYLLG